jgi:hypothetical protein
MEKVLYSKEYSAPIKYGYEPEHIVRSYVKFVMIFDFKKGLRFVVRVPNTSVCCRNPFKALLNMLEHESVGMAKYQRMKEDVRACGLYSKLDVK